MTTLDTGPRTGRLFEERIDPMTGEKYLAVFERGSALKEDSVLNTGTCFTYEERDSLGLQGLMPPAVCSPADQESRAYGNFLRAGDDVHKYLFLASLQDRNETLFYRLLLDHVEEMVPIVYTPTVGKACEQYSHIYRRARGLYISAQDRGRMVEILRNAPHADVRISVVTDNEAILGIGDQGVGGMGIAIGKLALYTTAAGIHPSQCMPIDLDVGTDNPSLLEDPLYLGARHPRLRGAAYLGLVDELVDAFAQVWPNALLQWEDFSNRNAFAILHRHRRRLLSFNDDIQGTGAVVVAGLRSALRQAGRSFDVERIVFFGAGASGAGSALAVRSALIEAGVPAEALSRRVLSLDSRGLIVADRPGLEGEKKEIACDPALVAEWTRRADGTIGLDEVVRRFSPTILVGASGQPSTFTEEIVRTMHRGCPRPVILALSNPTSKTEVTPTEALRWTDGAAIVGTGSPFAPVTHGGTTHQIGQGNNVLIFPGVGLGATAVGAKWLPDQAFTAAGRALFEYTAPSLMERGAPIYPPIRHLREVAHAVAIEVGKTLVEMEVAPPLSHAEIERRVGASIWEPAYLPYRPG
jgi:malic enzyme